MQNITLQLKVLACAEGKFRDSFVFKNDTAVLTSTLSFLSFPLLSLFLPHFFSLAGHLVGFISVGKLFGKAFRISELDERKDRWVVEQDFQANFRGNVTWFLPFFSDLLDRTMLILVWFENSPYPAKVRAQNCP